MPFTSSVTTFVPHDGAVIVGTNSAGVDIAPSVKRELNLLVDGRVLMCGCMHARVCLAWTG